MTPKVTYVPTVIQWTENGKTEQRTVNIQEGINFKLEQSGNKRYTAQAYDTTKGKSPLLKLSKEDAYNILGLSHAKEDGYKNKSGQYIYVLNNEDIKTAKKARPEQMTSWIGYGGRFVKSNEIKSNDPAKNGGLNIIHNGTNSNGQTENYEISVFYHPKK